MTKELRGFVNRVRKAQDKIYAGKVGKWISLELSVQSDYIRVAAFSHYTDCRVKRSEFLQIYKDYDAEEVSKSLAIMSQIVGFDI